MVTGGKGIHVIVPLSRNAAWDDAKAFAKALSIKIADQDPDHYIATMSKAKRKGRIFIDWLRNERGSTAVAPYSVRARKSGPVATPVTWEELADLDAANSFHIPDILGRIEEGNDPWAEAKDWKQSLTEGDAESGGRGELISPAPETSCPSASGNRRGRPCPLITAMITLAAISSVPSRRISWPSTILAPPAFSVVVVIVRMSSMRAGALKSISMRWTTKTSPSASPSIAIVACSTPSSRR